MTFPKHINETEAADGNPSSGPDLGSSRHKVIVWLKLGSWPGTSKLYEVRGFHRGLF